MAKIIELKILQPHFDDVKSGRKKAELRKNDRDFCVGDILILRECTGEKYTGKKICVQITHVLQDCGFGLAPDYAILSIKLLRGRAAVC